MQSEIGISINGKRYAIKGWPATAIVAVVLSLSALGLAALFGTWL